jgi:RHS repeat-associated protein
MLNTLAMGPARLRRGCGVTLLPPRNYNTSLGRFTSLDTFEGHTDDPLTLNRYVYAQSDPVNLVDPSGHEGELSESLMSLAIGTSLRSISIGAVVGGVIGEVGYFAGTPMSDWSSLGALGATGLGALSGAFGSTLIGSAYFAVQGIYSGIQAWRDPNATGLQKALGSVNIILGVASAYFLPGQVRSQVNEWANVFSKIPLRTEVQRDLTRIKQAFHTNQEPVSFGRTTIYFGDNPRAAGGVIDDASFYLTQAAFDKGDDFLMKVIIEENVHIQRIREGVVEGLGAAAGEEGLRKAEEGVVGGLVDQIFKAGRERSWW